jgi:type I restriction enzyme S subunit
VRTLREAGVSLIDCVHKTPPAVDEGYPYVAIPQLKDGRIDLSDARRITKQDFLLWTQKAHPRPNDVVLSRRCNPGETAPVPFDLDFALGQNLVLLRADPRHVYPPFLQWLVSSPQWWEQIHKYLNAGAVFDSLKCADVPKFELPIPPILEQQAIASVLGSLAHKIELNRKMSATLEAMARALFKSWFVDFDPVRAKAEGRDARLPAEIAALFPDSFEETNLGEIPAGWNAMTIRDLASTIQYGFTTSAKQSRVGPRFLRITDIQGGQVSWDKVPFCVASSSDRERFRIVSGDILVARTGASTGENIYISDAPDAVFASYLVRFQFATKVLGRFVGAFMRTNSYFDYIAGCLGGSAQPNASAQTLAGAELVVPSQDILRVYADIVFSFDSRIYFNSGQNATLSTLRDTLLPKLISGEIRVGDAERALAASA